MTEVVKVAPPAEGVVLRVSGLKRGVSEYYYPENCNYTDFATGWEAAIDLAMNRDEMKAKDICRVVVDLYGDWTATKGEFCNSGDGFNWDAIYFPANVCVTLDMNGYTINRGLESYQYNGEVMYVDENADVIINNGTIKGGFSCNGAGGIHINDGANVTLNNVNVIENKVEDDDGAGIAIYDGATLTMNGGSISDNQMKKYAAISSQLGGGIYAHDSTVSLIDVTIENNQSTSIKDYGTAICSDDSIVTLERCKVIGNGNNISGDTTKGPVAVIYAINGGTLTITDTEFTGNGQHGYMELGTKNSPKKTPISLIRMGGTALVMDGCNFYENNAMYLVDINRTDVTITNTDFTDGIAHAIYGVAKSGANNVIKNCKFTRGVNTPEFRYTLNFTTASNLTFTDCNLGNATINNRDFLNVTTRARLASASMFGTGSVAVIISFVALIGSAAAIGSNIATNKKRNKSDDNE